MTLTILVCSLSRSTMTHSPGLRQRHLQGEIMDQPDLDPGRHDLALRGLARVNRWSNASRILWRPLAELARETGSTLRVLDLATGGGDVPLTLWRRAKRAGLPIQVDGCDVSLRAVDFARRQAESQGADVRFFELDALTDELPDGYDVVVCSLFLHHLDDCQAERLLRHMAAAAKKMFLVNDLVRSLASLLVTYVGTRALSWSDVVHTDGPLSVRAAFTVNEVRELARRAQLDRAVIRRHWPFRYSLTWRRP